MHTLYDSDAFIVTHLQLDVAAHGRPRETPDATGTAAQPELVRHGFEIVDKRSGKELYLDGNWAELFRQRLAQWQQQTPTQEEVEDTLAQYAELAQTPVTVH